jgi:NAD(P)-dependent dehydrogenase (short-subunit alcohol dehydrogenase family)
MGDDMAEGILENQVALVTGGGRGLGRALAVGLARAGVGVGVLARNPGELAAVVDRIHAAGGMATALIADLEDQSQVMAALDRLTVDLGPPTILINNAAVVAPLGPTVALERMAVETAIRVNVVAPIALTASVLPAMIARGWGRIVNVSSGIAAAPGAMPGMTTYATSKAGLEAHTISVAAELDGSGVTANVYRPGTVDTAMQAWIRDQSPARIGQTLHAHFAAMHADGRLISPEQSARSLLARLPSPVTGQIWTVEPPQDEPAPSPSQSLTT